MDNFYNEPTRTVIVTESEAALLELALEVLKRKALKSYARGTAGQVEDTRLLQAKLKAARGA